MANRKGRNRRRRSKYWKPANASCHAAQYQEGDPDWVPLGEPKFPTFTQPGTKERVAVFAQRLHDGYELWHEHDLVAFQDLYSALSSKILSGDERVIGNRKDSKKE